MKWILINTDRHFNNFGVLRDTKTLAFVGMAPIFDSGNSMFWKNPRLPEYDDLANIEVNSFRNTEKQLLGLNRFRRWINHSYYNIMGRCQFVFGVWTSFRNWDYIFP